MAEWWNGRVTLTDGDVAVLAGQAVGLLDADVRTVIEPADPVDPYRRRSTAWTVWPMLDRHRTVGVRVESSWTAADALARILDALSRHVADTRTFWAHTFPICPGHEHASDISVRDGEVVLSCPVTGVESERLRPAVS